MNVSDFFHQTAMWLGIIGSAVNFGIFFSFSIFIMKALSLIRTSEAINAMNSINRVIVRTLFLPIFFATALADFYLIIHIMLNMDIVAAFGSPALFGALSYIFGCFGITVAFNVPLNHRLSLVISEQKSGQNIWNIYMKEWTFWNHIRTTACLLSLILLILSFSGRH